MTDGTAHSAPLHSHLCPFLSMQKLVHTRSGGGGGGLEDGNLRHTQHVSDSLCCLASVRDPANVRRNSKMSSSLVSISSAQVTLWRRRRETNANRT